MSDPAADPAVNLTAIKTRLSAALEEAGREPGSVNITAVSKTFDADAIRPALIAGHRIFGENRVQEAGAKWPGLRKEFSGVELRLIGSLQSNKAKEAVALFDVVETVDRDKIARALSAEMEKQDRPLPVLIQVNTGEEPQKAGVQPRDADAFVERCRREYNLNVAGLMCIPPQTDAPSPHFALLANIAVRNDLSCLSMGMSSDFAIAAQLGATHVRIGTGVFGARP